MKNKLFKHVFVGLFCLYCCSFCCARTIFVNGGGLTGANNGSSWRDAFTELTPAINAATDGDQIWITSGAYYPTRSTDRTISFVLKSGVALYGGFVGTENSLQERNFGSNNTTLLSGDIGTPNNSDDNSYHVVKGENVSNVLFDHISIKAGKANGAIVSDKKGAGLYLAFSGNTSFNITLSYFSIYACDAMTEGGGAYIGCKDNASVRLTSSFTEYNLNSAAFGAGFFLDLSNAKVTIQSYTEIYQNSKAADSGGGVYIRNTQNSAFVWDGKSVDFLKNQSINKGGGFVLSSSDNSTAKIDWKSLNGLDNTLSNNAATKGGVAYIESLSGSDNTFTIDKPLLEGNLVSGENTEGAVISNNTVSGRSKIVLTNAPKIFDNSIVNTNPSANPKGTIIYNYGSNATSSVTLSNCLFSKSFNRTGSGGVVYNDDNQAQITLTQCVIDSSIAGKDGGVIYMNGGHLTIDSSSFVKNEAGGMGSAVFFQAQEGEHKIDIRYSQIKDSKSKNSAVYLLADRNAVIKPYFFKTNFLNSTNLQTSDVAGGIISFRAISKNAKISAGKVIQCVWQNGKGYAGAVLHEALGGLCEVTYTHSLFHNNAAETATMLNKVGNTEGVCTILCQNTLFWKNVNLNGGLERTVQNQQDNVTPKPRPIFSYCLMPENDCGALDQSVCNNNVFGQDPLLIQVYGGKPEYLEYAPCSPAINAGNNSVIPAELTVIDAPSGQYARILDGKVDIGASEYASNNHEYAKILDEPNRTLFADKSYQDSLGWTHYYNCTEKKLILSVKTDSTSIGKLTDSLKVSMTTTADYGIKAKILRGADYFSSTSACDRWVVMNRFWQIKGARSLSRATDTRFYFMPKDSFDLQKTIPFTAYADSWAYQVTKTTAQDTIVKGKGGNFTKQKFSAQNASLSEWFLKPNSVDYRISQFQIADLNSSGSAGILKSSGTKITEIDTFICHNSTMKVGDKVLFPGRIYNLTLKNSDGCDSLVRINIGTNILLLSSSGFTNHDFGFALGSAGTSPFTGYSHRWNTGDTTYYIDNLKAGTYTDIISYLGCIDTLTFIVRKIVAFELPNAFTPNGDGLNDSFYPVLRYWDPIITQFKIYNRAGHLVYNNENPKTGWDGTDKGQEAPSDVYAYWIEFDFGYSRIVRSSGEVILMR